MTTRATDAAPLRVLRMAELLCRHPIVGLSNSEMAEALGYTRPNVSRDVDMLIRAGWAERLPDGKYAVTTHPLALFRHAEIIMDNLTRRSNEFGARVEARARQLQD